MPLPEYGSHREVAPVHGVAGGHHVGGRESLRRQVGHREVPVVGRLLTQQDKRVAL